MKLEKNKKAGIIGGGEWGSVLGKKLAENSWEVNLYSKDLKYSSQKRGKLNYFKEIKKLKDSNFLVLAVPSFAIRQVLEKFKPFYSGQPILGIAKGIEKQRGYLSHQIVEEVLGRTKYAHLSGPSFASEVSRGLPTKLSLALRSPNKKYFQDFLSFKNLKIELTQDLIGVELGGAFKNVIAILSGISDGLNFGHNFRSALILEGFKEMIELGEKLGARKSTFWGPAGLGDLILTSTSLQSRNYRYGLCLAKKRKILAKETVEGVETSCGVYYLVKKHNLRLPVIKGVYEIIYKKKSPKKILDKIKQNL